MRRSAPLTILSTVLIAFSGCAGGLRGDANEQRPPVAVPKTASSREALRVAASHRPLGSPPTLNWVLLGVDVAKARAYVREADDVQKTLAILTVDLASGAIVGAWRATEPNARTGDAYHAWSEGFEPDLARMGAIVQSTRPLHSAPLWWIPTLAVSPDGKHIVYQTYPTDGSSGDWLFLADANGKHRRRLDDLVASYHPLFSPDSTRIVWEGCSGHQPCSYFLVVQDLEHGGPPTHLTHVPNPGQFGWSADGSEIYVAATRPRGSASETCLMRVEGRAPYRATSVRCADDLSLAIDPGARRAVTARSYGPAGKQVYEYAWVDLPSGTVTARRAVPRATGVGLLGPRGVVVTTHQRGLAVVRADSDVLLPDRDHLYFSILGARWISDDEIVVMRDAPMGAGFDLVIVDTAAVLAGIGAPY